MKTQWKLLGWVGVGGGREEVGKTNYGYKAELSEDGDMDIYIETLLS